MKRVKGRAEMKVVNFDFGKSHFIVVSSGNKIAFYKAPFVLSLTLTRRIIKHLLNELEDAA